VRDALEAHAAGGPIAASPTNTQPGVACAAIRAATFTARR
jgi:hypothetical protein